MNKIFNGLFFIFFISFTQQSMHAMETFKNIVTSEPAKIALLSAAPFIIGTGLHAMPFKFYKKESYFKKWSEKWCLDLYNNAYGALSVALSVLISQTGPWQKVACKNLLSFSWPNVVMLGLTALIAGETIYEHVKFMGTYRSSYSGSYKSFIRRMYTLSTFALPIYFLAQRVQVNRGH